MTRGLVLVAEGMTDTHLEYAYHRLRDDAVLVDVAAPQGGRVQLASGRSWDARSLSSLPPARRYDLMVVPGGTSPARLAADGSARRRLEAHLVAGGIVCAMLEGITLLLAIDGLDGRLVAAPAAFADELSAVGATLTAESITVDGPVVTVAEMAALPFGIAAALASVAIPQGAAAEARERPSGEFPMGTERGPR